VAGPEGVKDGALTDEAEKVFEVGRFELDMLTPYRY